MQPNAVAVYPLEDGSTDIILRKDIAQAETDDGTVWQCEERQFHVPRSLTAEDVAASFDDWWAYTPGTDDPEDIPTPTEPGKAERLEAVEAALLELGTAVAENGIAAETAATSISELTQTVTALQKELAAAQEDSKAANAELAALKEQIAAQAAETEAKDG